MKIQPISYPMYNVTFGKLKKEKPQSHTTVINHTYNPKVWTAALAFAVIPVSCTFDTKNEDNFNKEKFKKIELTNSVNKKRFNKNDSIIREIKDNDSTSSHYHFINQLNEENNINKNFTIKKLENGNYLAKTKLNDRIITTTIDFSKINNTEEYNGKLTINNTLDEYPPDTFEYKINFNKNNQRIFDIRLRRSNQESDSTKFIVTRNADNGKLFIQNCFGEITELSPIDLKERPQYSINDYNEIFEKRGAQMQDIKDQFANSMAIMFIGGLALGLIFSELFAPTNKNNDDNIDNKENSLKK